MGKNFRIFKFFILSAVVLPLSCATRLPAPMGVSGVHDGRSTVFGEIETEIDDDKVVPNPSRTIFDWTRPTILCFFSPYVSNDKLNRNPWLAGKYFFRTSVDQNGHFSFVVPSGKYYFVEFDFYGFFAFEDGVILRTYMSKRPFLITFDAPANRAVYIGTIVNDFDVKWDNPSFFKTWVSVSATNDFAEAKRWFLKSNPLLETNIVEQEIQITSLSNSWK